jgi:hypothetical protein
MSSTRSPHTPVHRSADPSFARTHHVVHHVAVVALALASTVAVVALTSTLVARFG